MIVKGQVQVSYPEAAHQTSRGKKEKSRTINIWFNFSPIPYLLGSEDDISHGGIDTWERVPRVH